MIREFFVVTETSVYRVEDGGGRDRPSATKVALRGESTVPVGRVMRGTAIIIGSCLYAESPEENHGGHSSSIVALFKNKEEALRCLENEDLKPYDPRWTKQTRKVLNKIGDNHPAFRVFHILGRRLGVRGIMMAIAASLVSAATLLFGALVPGVPIFVLSVFIWGVFSFFTGHLVNFLTWILYYYAVAMAITTISSLFGMEWTKGKYWKHF